MTDFYIQLTSFRFPWVPCTTYATFLRQVCAYGVPKWSSMSQGEEKPLLGRSKKVRIDNRFSSDLSDLSFNERNKRDPAVECFEVGLSETRLDPEKAAKLLHDDVVAKQCMIDRLIKEADEHAAHIKESGQMIVTLRNERKDLLEEIEAIKKQTAEVQERTSGLRKKAMKETFNLTGTAATGKRIKDLIHLIREQRVASSKLISQIDITQGEIARGITKEDRQQMAELEKAQGVKALYIEKLEAATKDGPAYRNGVKNNETLIKRLEQKLYSNRIGGNLNSVRIVGGVSLAKENEIREASAFAPHPPHPPSQEVLELEKQKSDLQIHNKALHLTASGAKSVADLDPRDRRLLALREQLVENATKFAKTISKLKLQLMEIESSSAADDAST